MRNQYRNKRMVQIACIDKTKEPDRYGKYTYLSPIVFNENVMSVDSSSELTEYGERVKNMYKAIVQKRDWESKLHNGDAVYIDTSSENDSVIGSQADYFVESVRDTSINTLTIYFEKKPGGNL